MKIRKLLLVAVASALAFSMIGQSAQAGDSGTKTDSQRDTINVALHPQNSFRPPLPYSGYQYQCDGDATQSRCTSIMDLGTARVVTDPLTKKISLTMTTTKPLPAPGAPITSLPTPFTAANYSWYFQASHQDSRMKIGEDCLGEEFAGNLSPLSNQRVYIDKVTRSSTCPAARITASGTTEATGVADGTRTRRADKVDVYTVPRPRADGWWSVVTVEMAASDTAPGTIEYKLLWGQYEGYSGFSESEEVGDAVNASEFSFQVSGNTITATVPYEPKRFFGPDDDLMIDDAAIWPFPLGRVGSSLTAFVPQINGVAEAGSPTAFCPFGPDFFPEENTIPPVGYPQSLPGADGGQDCVRGVFGLLTVRDWLDGGFELRAVPRSPAYAPSPSSVGCRYPIGYFPAPPAPVNVPTTPGSVDASTSPFHRPWEVGVWTEGPGPKATVVSSGPQAGLPNPSPNPINLGVIGQDRPCNYTVVPTGLHYFDVLSPDVPM